MKKILTEKNRIEETVCHSLWRTFLKRREKKTTKKKTKRLKQGSNLTSKRHKTDRFEPSLHLSIIGKLTKNLFTAQTRNDF